MTREMAVGSRRNVGLHTRLQAWTFAVVVLTHSLEHGEREGFKNFFQRGRLEFGPKH